LADVFVSYSRRDTDFVQRIAGSLAERGKSVWIDTEGIADAEVFPLALRSAIEESDSFLFIITPASVASPFCDQEVSYARSLEKRIVPVLRAPVPDPDVPEEIRQRNWIPFTEDDDYATSLDRVVRAVDTDLELVKAHTRWLVKALEWDAEGQDRSFLLRGSELKTAEDWLARTLPDADPAPTTLQSEYILASRRAATRRQRVLLATSAVVAAVAIGLGVVAFLARNQAVSASTIARSQALGAESQNELSADPEVSVLLARRAVQQAPTGQAVSALRQAMDASSVRRALPIEPVTGCKYQPTSLIAYSPTGDRVAEGSCTGQVTVIGAASGRIVFRRHLPGQEDDVAYDPDGRLLAVGTNRGVVMLDSNHGTVTSHLPGRGAPTALAFSPNGSMLAATTNFGVTVWDLQHGTTRQLIADPFSDYFTLAFTPNGQLLAVGTDLGYTAVVDVTSGRIVHQLTPPGQAVSVGPGSLSPVGLVGSILVVGEELSGPGDVSGDIDLWNTSTWSMTSVLTSVTGTGIGSVAVSPDQQMVAVGNYDGTGGTWSLNPDEELVPISGQTADLDTMAFSPDSRYVAIVANDGTTRIYRAGGPWRATLPADLCDCGNEIGWQSHRLVALARSGNDITAQTWSVPSGRLEPGSRVLNSDQQNEGVVLSPDGSLAALFNDETSESTVTVMSTATGRTVFTLPATSVAGVTISRDDRLLAVTDVSGGLHIATVSTGHSVTGHGWPDCDSGNGDDLVISSDDRRVAGASFCGQVSVGLTADAKPVETFDRHEQLSDIAFNPAGTRLAVASWDSTVTILNVTTDKPVLELVGHTRGVTGVAFAPTAPYIVTTSIDDTTRVWNANTGQLMEVDHDETSTRNPSVSPDGQFLAEANSDNQVRLWPVCPECLQPSALLASSRSSVVSPLTSLEHEAAAQAG
jgi:WD40 repeat protein